MQLNITTDYAIRTVLYLAIQNRISTSKEISEAMGIPLYYQFKITTKLVKSGIVKCFHGIRGGFCLNKTTTEISLFDIINAFEPTTRLNRCLEDDEYCSRFATKSCPVRNFYRGMQSEIEKNLSKVTVADLLNQQ